MPYSRRLKTRAPLGFSSGYTAPESSSLGCRPPLLQSPTLSPVMALFPLPTLGYLSWDLRTIEQHSQEFIKVPSGAPNLDSNLG